MASPPAHAQPTGRRRGSKTSAYAKAIKEVLTALEANRASLLAGATLTDDFRIYAVEHEY
jgi:hypothetical protein